MNLELCRPCVVAFALTAAAMPFVGCGVTRSTDTARTATEQLLISDAIDRAVDSMNLQPLAGQTIFLDDSKVTDAVDRNYYISTLRQQLLAHGCELKDKREEADFIVEARAGAIGTDRNDLLFGVPTTSVPAIPVVSPLPSTVPEIPIAKRKDQVGVAKIAIFAYHRASGTPVWQSGIVRQESTANDVWILGAGPFQHGTIYEDGAVASTSTASGSPEDKRPKTAQAAKMKVARESLFTSPEKLVQKTPSPGAADKAVAVASHDTPSAAPPATPTPAPAAPAPQAPAAKPDSKATASNTSIPASQAANAAPTTKQPGVASSSTLTKAAAAPKPPQAINSAYAGLGISSPQNKPALESAD